MFDVPIYPLAAVLSFAFVCVIVYTQRLHGRFSHDNQPGVQKLHRAPVPRIGGVAIFGAGGLIGFALSEDVQTVWWMIGATVAPVFLIGLAEDITKRVGVLTRLLVTVSAGGLFVVVTQFQINHTDIFGIDWLLSFGIMSFVITAVAMGGISNAINIIDGVNGLASGTVILGFLGLGVVAMHSGDTVFATVGFLSASLVFGFFVMNFPYGKIFLGDAGAYTLGFVLAAMAIALPQRNPELSPLMALVAVSYPVIETMVSIHRRVVRRGAHPGRADRLHLHSLVYRDMARQIAGRLGQPNRQNAIAGAVVLMIPAMSSALLPFVARSAMLSALGIAVVFLAYIALYRRVALLPHKKAVMHRADPALGARNKAFEIKDQLWSQRRAGSVSQTIALSKQQGVNLIARLAERGGQHLNMVGFRIGIEGFQGIISRFGLSHSDLLQKRLTRLIGATLGANDALIHWGEGELLLIKQVHDGQDQSVYAEFLMSLLRGDAQFLAIDLSFSINCERILPMIGLERAASVPAPQPLAQPIAARQDG